MYLVGQKKNKELIDSGKLDNATFILIKGPRNHGKTYLTKYIASHYKMDYIQLDNKVETIRQLVSSSDKNNNCLYHFKNFDMSSPAAKAALLKIAEETPKGVKIVVTTSAYNFLQTLISRAYVMEMSPYCIEELEEYGSNLNVDNDLISELVKAQLDITPTLLFNLKGNEDVMEILALANETIECINKGLLLENISIISSKFWKDDKERVQLYLDILSRSTSRLNTNRFRTIQMVQETAFTLNRVAINNYRNLIHNMLMELV